MHKTITLNTTRGLHDISDSVKAFVESSGVSEGLLCVFCPHTSCSLILNENCDAEVQTDLERWLSALVKEDFPFDHTYEGADDMPAHVKTTLTQSSITIPVIGGRVVFGTWQGLFLWEHRDAPHVRKIVLMLTSCPK